MSLGVSQRLKKMLSLYQPSFWTGILCVQPGCRLITPLHPHHFTMCQQDIWIVYKIFGSSTGYLDYQKDIWIESLSMSPLLIDIVSITTCLFWFDHFDLLIATYLCLCIAAKEVIRPTYCNHTKFDLLMLFVFQQHDLLIVTMLSLTYLCCFYFSQSDRQEWPQHSGDGGQVWGR